MSTQITPPFKEAVPGAQNIDRSAPNYLPITLTDIVDFYRPVVLGDEFHDSHPHQSLQKLYLSFWRELLHSVILKFLPYISNLEILGMSPPHQLDLLSLLCVTLLVINACYDLNDQDLEAITSTCKFLRELVCPFIFFTFLPFLSFFTIYILPIFFLSFHFP
jgi:hypothetical protein